MDTNQAISTLQALQQDIQSSIVGKQAQLDALTVALQLLQGTLKTQLDTMAVFQTQMAQCAVTLGFPDWNSYQQSLNPVIPK